MQASARPGPRLVALYFVAWTGFAVFFFTQDVTRATLWGDATPWWHFLTSWLIGMYLCALLAPAILALGDRFPLERRFWVRRTALHLGASVLFSFVHLTLDAAILTLLPILPQIKPKTFLTTFVVLFILGFHGNIVTYWLILGIQHAVRTYRRYQEREADALRLSLQAAELRGQLTQAQLSGLKAQLQPHFLFNTLNAIMVLVRQARTRQAEEMLARLSDLLRTVLDEVETQEVPLRRELEFLDLYLSIEQVRFQDRLRIEIAAAPETLDAAVPHLGLQPLVENAVRHGIGRRSAAGRIEIRAARDGGALRIEVRDDGPGLAPEPAAQTPGIGLANTRARLRQLYGDTASLAVENGALGGTVATVVLPFHVAPAPAAPEAIALCS